MGWIGAAFTRSDARNGSFWTMVELSGTAATRLKERLTREESSSSTERVRRAVFARRWVGNGICIVLPCVRPYGKATAMRGCVQRAWELIIYRDWAHCCRST